MLSAPRAPTPSQPSRLRPLAALPLFFDLRGKMATVAGDGDAVVWKAELLAAAGAEVRVLSAHPTPELEAVAERGAGVGAIRLEARHWVPNDLLGATLAVLDSDDETEIDAFRCAARTAGALVNVVGKPAVCDVQFGSIVNRSPVVVGISSDGTAPVLSQAIRRRIEAMLPASLSEWGDIAGRIRDKVASVVPSGAARRGFWDRFAALAFARPPESYDEAALVASAGRLGGGETSGKVVLCGAGPGDAELLTLKAVRALQAADVVLHDDLVSPDVLDLARREAKRVTVGKRGGRLSCRQDDINALMVRLARQGRQVVRLKAGDPLVFGRAGEEIALLEREGIAVEVVPGISAGIALAAALGVSLTHRDVAHSLRFITGHAKSGDLDDGLDWHGFADPQSTLIVYMGGRTAPRIAARLIEEGLDAATPVAIGYAIGQAGQRIVARRLADLLDGGTIDNGPPVVIGIGKVFAPVLGEPVSLGAEAGRQSAR